MYVKIVSPTTIAGLWRVAAKQILALAGAEALALITAGTATPRPDLDEQAFQARKERARKLGQNVDWDRQPEAARWLTIVGGAMGYPDANESFAEKISRAVKEQAVRHPNTRKAADERAEAERSRYGRGGLQPRQRTKGERWFVLSRSRTACALTSNEIRSATPSESEAELE